MRRQITSALMHSTYKIRNKQIIKHLQQNIGKTKRNYKIENAKYKLIKITDLQLPNHTIRRYHQVINDLTRDCSEAIKPDTIFFHAFNDEATSLNSPCTLCPSYSITSANASCSLARFCVPVA